MADTSSRFMRSLRLLPVLVIASVLLLTVRIGELTTGVEIGGTTVAIAETEEKAAGTTSAEKASSDTPASGTTHDDPPKDPEDDFEIITHFTEEELVILQDLAKRRDALGAREQEIEDRGRLLDAAQARLETQIAELQEIRTSIESLVREYDEQEQAELESVVKIYETMKPKDAARILGELEMSTLLGIMERMKERKTAPILAAMEPKRARAVTAEMARKRTVELGAPRGAGG